MGRPARWVRLAGAVLGLVVVTGCGAYGATLAQREVVVRFALSATPAQHDAARRACSGLPNAAVEPAPRSTLRSVQLNDVRFRVDRASTADLARLYDCLRRQPGVVGVQIPSGM